MENYLNNNPPHGGKEKMFKLIKEKIITNLKEGVCILSCGVGMLLTINLFRLPKDPFFLYIAYFAIISGFLISSIFSFLYVANYKSEE